MKYLLISMLILLTITGCEPVPPAPPTMDRCLGLHTVGLPECRPPASLPESEAQPTRTPVPITLLNQEISARLGAIGVLLGQEPMTQGEFQHATIAVYAYGKDTSNEFRNWTLQDLLRRLEGTTPEINRSGLQKLRNWFEDLEQLRPQDPFLESEPADPQKVQAARELFDQIEAEWQLYLEQVK